MDRSPLNLIRRRDDLFSNAHSQGKVTFGKARAVEPDETPMNLLPSLKPALLQSSQQDMKTYSKPYKEMTKEDKIKMILADH
jgi:hypothetical protein